MYLTKIPKLLQRIYSDLLWRHETDEKVIYLTFDDGPTPEITDWVLAQLAAYQAQATFFVIGKNAKTHPHIIHRILAAGHVLGNHTQNHINGHKATLNEYLDDFYEATQTLTAITGKPTTLFRPPYGKIKSRQARPIQETHKVVMMDILAGDFDPNLTQEACLDNILKFASPGSIVCLHDSVKAFPHLEYVLPRVLAFYGEKGWRFAAV